MTRVFSVSVLLLGRRDNCGGECGRRHGDDDGDGDDDDDYHCCFFFFLYYYSVDIG
jgi:hypothetical protein